MCLYFLLPLAHLFSLTSLTPSLPLLHTHTLCLVGFLWPPSLPSPSRSLACPSSQLLWPLNITQAVSAKLWMSLDTYSTQTPFGISICTEPISIFIAGLVGASVKPAVRISQSWTQKQAPWAKSVSLCERPHVFVSSKRWLTQPWRLSEPTFWQLYHPI